MVVEWTSEGLGQLAAGSAVWYRVVTKAQRDAPWQTGKLVAVSPDDAQVQPGGRGEVVTLPLRDVQPANPELLDAAPDLTSLSHLNEPSILHTLDNRYTTDVIYTKAGPVLIALNPCKSLPLYKKAVVDDYRRVHSDLDAAAKTPHIFLNAGKAFRDMVDNKLVGLSTRVNTSHIMGNMQSQSMVISGESGAGKTETTKKAMQFFAQMSGGHGIEDQVLQTNPLLEAFGNAKTLRNHNSSRFGKLLEIHFNASNHICGAKILTYLLEKSRVVHQIAGERSFHIFYQMIRGASAADREAWRVPADVSAFKYLSGAGAVTTIDGVDDAAEFQDVRDAMTAVHIEPELQQGIFKIVSAVLWLGNVSFTAKSDDETRVVVDDAFSNVSELLGVPPERLIFALTHRLMSVGKETYEKTLNMENALDTRDALAKALYSAVFSFMVDRVNASLASEKRLSGKFISILDIYGFESFTKNSFEQLCINYANERLQQQFNKHLFKLEQEEYTSEGIDWSHIEFEDNQDCLDVIDAKPPKGLGVMTILDDQCNFPRSTDTSFCSTIRERINSRRFTYKPGGHIDFIIEHYAGPVTYDAAGFLDKNRDTVSVDIVSALGATGDSMMKQLLPYVQNNLEGKSKATVASRFREQLLDLVARLDCTEMHFVRCIKPNYHLKPSTFDQAMILQQLRCCGVLEVVRIAKAGYPTRYEHQTFVDRYIDLMPRDARGNGDTLSLCRALLEYFRVPEAMWQIGRTKIFFRAGVLGAMEDLWRRTKGAVQVIQAQVRMHIARTRFVRMREASTVIAAARRGQVQRRKFKIEFAEHKAAITAQAAARRWLARHEAKRRRDAIVVIQCGLRRVQFRKRCAVREADMRQALEFAQNRALRAKEQEIKMRQELALWHKIQEDFQMDPDQVRDALMAWRAQPDTAATSQTSTATAGAGLSEHDAKELKLFQVHREAFFAWQMGSGTSPGEPSTEEEQRELEIWRAHRAQFFKWQQKRVDGDNGATEGQTGQIKRLQDHIQALRVQFEEQQERAAQFQTENTKLKAHLRPRHDPTIAPVERLKNDFHSRTETMDDDLSFIQEVVGGAATAIPEFNAELEIRKLKMSFDQWKETFKTRMRETYMFVKKASVARGNRRMQPRHMYSSNVREPFNLRDPQSPGSDDLHSPTGDNKYVARVKEGIKGATKAGMAMKDATRAGTGVMKDMVGRLQRKMSAAQHEMAMRGEGPGGQYHPELRQPDPDGQQYNPEAQRLADQ